MVSIDLTFFILARSTLFHFILCSPTIHLTTHFDRGVRMRAILISLLIDKLPLKRPYVALEQSAYDPPANPGIKYTCSQAKLFNLSLTPLLCNLC